MSVMLLIEHTPQEAGHDEALNGIDVAGDATDEIAGLCLIVKGERKPLNVGIKNAPEVVRDPLADAGCDVLFDVRADGVENGDSEHGDGGEFEDRVFIGAGHIGNEVVQPTVRGLFRLQNAIEDNLDGPGVQQIGDTFAGHRREADDQQFPMRLEKIGDLKRFRSGGHFAGMSSPVSRSAHLMASTYIFWMRGSSQVSSACPKVE